ncbi:hypothetical protein EVAR_53758_1 [Eumeta japonica]|uniref:Uncharacterized protein n=1 Tax=Eumeta variegata TaxID=151549 RepID=A0A4C1ZEG3_EUMVA|nr:hypothetical protein EVAR_53758_1 [Eumeta japonica]
MIELDQCSKEYGIGVVLTCNDGAQNTRLCLDLLITPQVAPGDTETLLALGFRHPLWRFQLQKHQLGCAVSNPGSNKLAKLLRKLKFDIMAPPLTHYADDLVSHPSIIDIAITKEWHLTTMVERCLRVVPASVNRRKLPANTLELLRAKKAALRHACAYPSRDNRSRAGFLTSCESTHD